jgi:hypothetical protein
MIATEAYDCSSPLLDPGILHMVLSYIGPGHCLFMAPVSKLWNGIYATLGSQQLTVAIEWWSESSINCGPQMTLFSSMFASPSRVNFAHDSGLDCTSEAYQHAAGKHADIATLAAAHSLGMQYTSTTMAAAVRCNKLAEVHYLYSKGCPWPTESCSPLGGAASSAEFALLRWCYEHGCPWEASTLPYYAAVSSDVELMAWVLQQPDIQKTSGIMCAAASSGCRDMCEYLHAQGCPWDSGYIKVLI